MSANGFLKYLCLSFVFMGSAYINSALAEGRCPPGQYPIGDQGVGGCAPIPGAGRSAPDENPGHWVKTWGAVAGSMNGDAGASTGHQAKASAERQAIERCGHWGATDCKVLYTYYNQCYASIRTGRPDNGTMFNAGATKEQALERATQDCRNSGSQECTFVHSTAPSPSFRRADVANHIASRSLDVA